MALSDKGLRLVTDNREGYLRSLLIFFAQNVVASSHESRMDKLPKDIAQLLDNLCREGDRFAGIDQYDDAIARYQAAWDLLPAPQNQWPAATWILMSVGDAYYRLKEFDVGAELLLDALDYPDGDTNPFLSLRLGQCLLELGQLDAAANALEDAFRRGGEAVFEGEDPKYLGLVRTQHRLMNDTPTTGRFNRPLQ